MFYVIRNIYIGPNQDSDFFRDFDNIEISTIPAIANSSKQTCINGWCGATNDISVYAHGVYSTLQEAREAVIDKFGKLRDWEDSVISSEIVEEEIIQKYRLNKYVNLNSSETYEWACDLYGREVRANTTNEQIHQLAVDCEAEANRNGGTLSSINEILMGFRDELRKEEEAK